MGFYEDNIVPRIVDLACGRKDIAEHRREVASGLSGEVVEIGFGSGLNVPHYPAAVSKVLAVGRPLRGRAATGGLRSGWRRHRSPWNSPASTVRSFPSSQGGFDAALSTFTLCTIPDVGRALAEVRRVLRPGGRFYFLERGLSPDPRVARWQQRLTPVQRRLCGGCHFNRQVGTLVTTAGFEVSDLRNFHLAKVPKVVGYMYQGSAVVPG